MNEIPKKVPKIPKININPMLSFVIWSWNFGLIPEPLDGNHITRDMTNNITGWPEIYYLKRSQFREVTDEIFIKEINDKLILTKLEMENGLIYDKLRDIYPITSELINFILHLKILSNDKYIQKIQQFYEIFPWLNWYFGYENPRQFDFYIKYNNNKIINPKKIYESIDSKYYIIISDRWYAFFVKNDDFKKYWIASKSFILLPDFHCKFLEWEQKTENDNSFTIKKYTYGKFLFYLKNNQLLLFENNEFLCEIKDINDILWISRDWSKLYCSMKVDDWYSALVSIDIPLYYTEKINYEIYKCLNFWKPSNRPKSS